MKEKKELTGREAKNEQKKLRLERKMKRPDGELVFKVPITNSLDCRQKRFGTVSASLTSRRRKGTCLC